MARAAEKAAYEANVHSAQLFHDVGIVMLTDAERLDKPQDSNGGSANDSKQRPADDDPQIS